MVLLDYNSTLTNTLLKGRKLQSNPCKFLPRYSSPSTGSISLKPTSLPTKKLWILKTVGATINNIYSSVAIKTPQSRSKPWEKWEATTNLASHGVGRNQTSLHNHQQWHENRQKCQRRSRQTAWIHPYHLCVSLVVDKVPEEGEPNVAAAHGVREVAGDAKNLMPKQNMVPSSPPVVACQSRNITGEEDKPQHRHG